MKTLFPACLLAAALLVPTSALHAQAVSSTHSYLNYSPRTGKLLDEEAEPQPCGFVVERPAVKVPAASLPTDQELQQQLAQLTQENLALDFRIGLLQTQVAMLSRRLAAFEDAAPLAEAYGRQPR